MRNTCVVLHRIIQISVFCLSTSVFSAEHWSFQPLKPGKGSSIDEFIQRGLAEQGLKPAPRADAHTLIRRATFDLTGWNLATPQIRMNTADKGTGRFVLAVRSQGVLSNPIKIALDAQPECLADEPAADRDVAQPVTLPIIVNG
ncbi:MAG: DUF1549 domain-containing protein, partial [Prosthecobacter sp.]